MGNWGLIILTSVLKQREIFRVKISAKRAYFVCHLSKKKWLASCTHFVQMTNTGGFKNRHMLQPLLPL